MAGFWGSVAFADLELPAPLRWGVVKGILLRNLRWWANQSNILTPQGTLTIGYTYPNQFMSENYNSPGSPYWFMLGFTPLALPETHPFWRSAEEPLPLSSIPKVVDLPHPLHIMVREGGHTFLLSSGQRCHYPVRASESKYGKFAYSSSFGYSVPTGGYFVEAVGGDNMIALSDDAGETWKLRRVTLDARVEKHDGSPVLVSGWKPWSDVSVESYLLPPTEAAPNWHVRVHHITAARSLRTSEGAFSLFGIRESDGRELETLSIDSSEGRHSKKQEALAVSKGGAVGIAELQSQIEREGRVLQEDANSNLVDARTVLPSLGSELAAGDDVWYATAVFAIASSVEGWTEQWRSGWESRPVIPEWLKEKMS